MNGNSHERSPASGLDVWSTTFADILTLVLSFFIATISISPLNPASEAARMRQIPSPSRESGGLAAQTVVAAKGGTPLAEVSRREPPRNPVEVVEFLDSDFSGGLRDLAPATRERIKNVVSLDGYRASSVRIESCDRTGDEAQGLARAMVLRRQVFDAGGGRPTIRVAVLDGDCRNISGISAEATARITIRRFE